MCFKEKVRLPVTEWFLSVCVSMIAPLCVCIRWQIADRQRVHRQVRGGGWGRLILSLALSSYRSPSILFSSCQNSQLCIDSSLLHLIFTQPNNKVRTKWLLASWISSNASKTSVFIKSSFIDLWRKMISFLEFLFFEFLISLSYHF